MDFDLVCVNDGSTDDTLPRLLEARKQHPQVSIVDFSRNFGKEAAMSAGLQHAGGDAVIIMDADLQHPPETIPRLVAAWREGYDVVLAKRNSRDGDTLSKKLSANLFYKIHNMLTEHPIPAGVGISAC